MANTKKYVSLDKLTIYDEKIKKVVTDGDAAALKSAKDYADSLAGNYDAAGTAITEAGKVQAELDKEVTRAKAREDEIAGLVATAQGEVDALEEVVATKAAQADLEDLAGKVGTVPTDKTVMGIIGEIQSGNSEVNETVQGQIAALESNKADKTQVATDIAAAIKVETDARVEAVKAVQDEVDALEKTHADDKAALEGAIALKADQTALDAVSGVANAAATKAEFDAAVEALEAEDARIAGLVATEAADRAEADAALQEQITANANAIELLTEGVDADKVDGVKDLIDYVEKHGAEVTGMKEDIAANAKAIEDHAKIDHDFAAADAALSEALTAEINKKADSTVVEGVAGRVGTLEGEMDAVEGRALALEGRMTTVEGAVATKVEQEAYNTKIAALEGVDAGLAGRIEALEAKHGDGEGTVESLIAATEQRAKEAAAADATTKANKALADAKDYVDGEIDTVEGTIATLQGVVDTKAAQADLTALAGRVTTAEGEIDTLQGEMDAVEALAAANESAIKALQTASATHATKDEVEAVSGRVTALETWHNNFTEVSEAEILELFN